MTGVELKERLALIVSAHLPLPGAGDTPKRHRLLAEIAREDLTLAKLSEAHWDAVAILSEAGREAVEGSLYGVWASEIPGHALVLTETEDGYVIQGTKLFCSGIDLVDRALVTAGASEHLLVELDLRRNADRIESDLGAWKVDAFRLTQTGAVTFHLAELSPDAVIGPPDWYTDRAGFWHGACGPAACWAGGIAGLVDAASLSKRDDPHTLAHLGGMHADLWAMFALLDQAGQEIDRSVHDVRAAQVRALKLRHLTEQMGTDVLRRFARAYGPGPLSMNEAISRRYHEADLYLRQSHAERDLEALGRLIGT